jgi:uncharacterized membrane protein YdbT with pleckstrin-like domain
VSEEDPNQDTGEQTLYSESPSMFRNNPIGFILTLLLCVVGVGLVVLLVWWLKNKGTVLTVTNERTILRRGLLSKSLNEVWHQDVRNVKLSQSFWQRIFGTGTLEISSAGQADVEIKVTGIPDPDDVKSVIDRFKMESDD